MAWIELHQTLPTNKKTVRLKNLLGIKTPQAVGHLCILWLWALDNAPDGDLSGFTDAEIAEFANWTGRNSNKFVDALINADFLTADRLIHNWSDYAGRLIEKRRSDAERKRLSRKKSENEGGQPGDVHRMSEGNPCDGAGNRTVPNSIVPNGDIPPPTPPGDEEKKKDIQTERFAEFWTAYPKKVGKEAAKKAWKRIKVNKELHERILSAVASAKQSDQWKRENGRFIPNPATWLNQGRWDDEYTQEPRAAPGKGDGFSHYQKPTKTVDIYEV